MTYNFDKIMYEMPTNTICTLDGFNRKLVQIVHHPNLKVTKKVFLYHLSTHQIQITIFGTKDSYFECRLPLAHMLCAYTIIFGNTLCCPSVTLLISSVTILNRIRGSTPLCVTPLNILYENKIMQ
jgi:hypothetical protein